MDELEVLMECGTSIWSSTLEDVWLTSPLQDDDVDNMVAKLEKISPHLLALLRGPIEDIRRCIQFVTAAGITRPIYFQPLFMLNNPDNQFKDGLCFEMSRRHKRSDVLAFGGR